MHDYSMRLMKQFASTVSPELMILDVGSRDVNGTFRRLFPNHPYVGIDIEPGDGVDVVVAPYSYPFPDNHCDVIISGSTLEHVRCPWKWMREVARILKPGGRLCVIVPYAYPYHEHPVDCWRVYPEGLRALFEDAGLTPMEIEMQDGTDGGQIPGIPERIKLLNPNPCGDTYGVATK